MEKNEATKIELNAEDAETQRLEDKSEKLNADRETKRVLRNRARSFLAKKDYLQVARVGLALFFIENPSLNDVTEKSTRQYFDDFVELVETFKTADVDGIISARGSLIDDIEETVDNYNGENDCPGE